MSLGAAPGAGGQRISEWMLGGAGDVRLGFSALLAGSASLGGAREADTCKPRWHASRNRHPQHRGWGAATLCEERAAADGSPSGEVLWWQHEVHSVAEGSALSDWLACSKL